MDILVIDDDKKFCTLLCDYLEPFGFQMLQAHTGRDGLAFLDKKNFELVLLDMMLPDMDGLDVLRELRKAGTTPVVILSAQDEEASRIVGLEMGADDYVPKAFSPRELLARLRAVLRRAAPDAAAKDGGGSIAKAGGVRMDTHTMTATLNEKALDLTPLEFRILYALVEQPGRVFSRERLLELLGREVSRFDRSIDMHISSLRKKLGDDPHHPRLLCTVRGAGYSFARENPA